MSLVERRAKELNDVLNEYVAICAGCGLPLKVHEIRSQIRGTWIDHFWRKIDDNRGLMFCMDCTNKIYDVTGRSIEAAVRNMKALEKSPVSEPAPMPETGGSL